MLALLATLTLTGCSTLRDTQPPRTANEQLLISTAADHAADQLSLQLPPNAKVFVDTSDFDAIDAKYAIGTLRDRLAKQGALLVADRKDADTVVELRSGALSINQRSMLIGLPAIPVPIPLAGTVTTPEIALYKKSEDEGVAKFAATALDAKQGRLAAYAGPSYGFSHRTHYVLLFFISWTREDIIPEGVEPRDELR
ncbi:MAG TPA: DUF6655 family protein [Stellaceae bacterium]|nr:DUF6655 family protein [Stellaceae bacterium]